MSVEAQIVAMRAILDRSRGKRPGRGRPRKSPVIAPTVERPERAAPEAIWALAFWIRRAEGLGWDRAAAETAAEFYLLGERAGPSRIERAARDYRALALHFLAERIVSPIEAARVREFLRERTS